MLQIQLNETDLLIGLAMILLSVSCFLLGRLYTELKGCTYCRLTKDKTNENCK